MLARQADDIWTLARNLARQALTGFVSGDLTAARSAAEEGLALAEQTGNGHTARSCRLWLAATLTQQGDLHRATSLLRGLIAEHEAERLLWLKAYCLGFLGQALAWMGEVDAARTAGEASIAIAGESGFGVPDFPGYGALSLAAMACGDTNALREVSQVIRQRASLVPEFGYPHHIETAEIHMAAGDLANARRYADEAIAAAGRLGLRQQLMQALLMSARVASTAGDVERAHDDAHRALTVARAIESTWGIIDALECLSGLARDAEGQLKAARLLGAAYTLRQHTGYQRFLLHQPRHDATLAGLRVALGDEAFGQAWDEGTALSLDDAVSYALRGRGERNRPPIGWLSLTPAELEVGRLVADGLPNKEIAAKLFVSPRTVQTHLTHMYGKLGITSRVQLAQQALRHSERVGGKL